MLARGAGTADHVGAVVDVRYAVVVGISGNARPQARDDDGPRAFELARMADGQRAQFARRAIGPISDVRRNRGVADDGVAAAGKVLIRTSPTSTAAGLSASLLTKISQPSLQLPEQVALSSLAQTDTERPRRIASLRARLIAAMKSLLLVAMRLRTVKSMNVGIAAEKSTATTDIATSTSSREAPRTRRWILELNWFIWTDYN
jgi:hypothetical protein